MPAMLLSINPEHVKNILNGTKKYEYRRVKCKREVNKIIIYSTAPVMKVVAEVEVLDVIEDHPPKLWNKTKKYSGISRDFFDEYFDGKTLALAFKLGQVKRFSKPKELSAYSLKAAPQSFAYID
jgi:predicted transcriptional regulator